MTVTEALDARVGAWFGPGSVLRWDGPPSHHAWSVQFRPTAVAPDGREVPLVVKVPVWDAAPTLDDALAAGPQQDTREEADALAAIAAMVDESGDPGLDAVRVIEYVPAVNAIVMERFPGSPLRSLLGRRVPGDPFVAAGRWLRHFHESVGGVAPGSFDADAVAGDVGRAAATLGRPDLVDRLAPALHRLGAAPVAVGATHGDFTLANVLVDADGRVAVIDPNRYRGAAAGDVARFVVDLRTHRVRAASLGLLPTSRRLRRWTTAFLDGYGDVDGEVLATMTAVAAIHRWADAAEASRGSVARRTLGGAVVRRCAAEARSTLAAIGVPVPA